MYFSPVFYLSIMDAVCLSWSQIIANSDENRIKVHIRLVCDHQDMFSDYSDTKFHGFRFNSFGLFTEYFNWNNVGFSTI